MSRSSLSQASRLASRALLAPNVSRSSFRLVARPFSPRAAAFSTCPARFKGIMPDTADPVHEPAPAPTTSHAIVEISDDEYHQRADVYMEDILSKFEAHQDAREGLDIEYSAGVMTLTVANKGTYVINKQPPNKQIWLSSPISGPKRYDWCVVGDGQGDKQGTAEAGWVYHRDGSTLGELFMEELGLDLDTPRDE